MDLVNELTKERNTMVESNSRVSEKDNLLGKALITQELPLASGSRDPSQARDSSANFRDQSLLVVDKKKKFVPMQAAQNSANEGVLSIPPEDPPNNCKSKFTHYTFILMQHSTDFP